MTKKIEKDASSWLLGNRRLGGITEQNPSGKYPKAKTVSITGGKGGVGKSSVAIKVAKILAENFSRKVLLIDCDYTLSNTAVKMGIPLNNDFHDLVLTAKNFSEVLYKDKNFHLLPGCNGNIDLFKNGINFEQFVIDLIMQQEKNYDFILLDCPAGLRKENLTINAYSDYRFIVVNPDKSSITDSYSLMKILSNSYGIKENHLIVNRANSDRQAEKLVRVLGETVENFLGGRLSILGTIFNLDVEIDQFDGELLKNSPSKIHTNFLNVVRNFTEKTLGEVPITDEVMNFVPVSLLGARQDVITNNWTRSA